MLAERRGDALCDIRSRIGQEGGIGANHWSMVNPWRRFVTLFGAETAGLVVG
jgi:hypothetical protein